MVHPPASAAPSVYVRDVCLEFGGARLFDRLNFVLEGGFWTCLLGASGIGKTSLLRLIAGLAARDMQGHIEASDGRLLAGRVAYMAQQDLLLPWLSVGDNVALGDRLRGTASRATRKRADELLERVGLGRHASQLPATLSGGMRQRAALARTLMEDRPVILMDEPFSGLDAITRLRVQDMAAELLAGRTVLLVSHDPLEALRLGHRVHVMTGRPARLGPALEPAGPPARDVTNPDLLAHQGDLLAQLARPGGPL